MSADSRIRILLVEDNPSDVFLLKSNLAKAEIFNFEVISVEMLRDALAVLDEQPVDVVVTDLHLPDSVGVVTLQRLVEKAGSLPIIALTGYDDPALGARLLEEGAHCYWSKDRIGDRALPDAIVDAIHRTLRRL